MKTKDKILETTFLLSLKYGYDNVSIKQIKDKSGIAASSIYHHFKDKDDILYHMTNKYILDIVKGHKEIMRDFDGSFFERLRFIFYYTSGTNIKEGSPIFVANELIDYKEYYYMFNTIYHQHPEYKPLFNELNKEMLNFFKELIDEAIANNEINKDLDSKEIAIFIFSAIKGYIEVWVGLPEFSLDEIINANVNNIWRAIKNK